MRGEVQHVELLRWQLDHAPRRGVEAVELDDVGAGEGAYDGARFQGRVRQARQPPLLPSPPRKRDAWLAATVRRRSSGV
jgi:hypothetical protein